MARKYFIIRRGVAKELEALAEKLGLNSASEVLDEAMALYIWAIKKIEAGHTICAVDDDNEIQVMLPGIDCLQRKIKK